MMVMGNRGSWWEEGGVRSGWDGVVWRRNADRVELEVVDVDYGPGRGIGYEPAGMLD
jgi:hypothetical protein